MSVVTIQCAFRPLFRRPPRQPKCNDKSSLEIIVNRDGDENELVDDGLVLDSGEGVDSELVLKLKATRSMMLNQINQMSATESSMLKSSSYIVRHEEILNGTLITIVSKTFQCSRNVSALQVRCLKACADS